jgi:hypothetical protein
MSLAVALIVGLLVRHVAVHAGRAVAARTRLRVPMLCGYAVAGTVAGLLKLVLLEWTTLPSLLAWAAFGAAWGTCAGLVLPLARRPAVSDPAPR